jgi:hypothetical protein
MNDKLTKLKKQLEEFDPSVKPFDVFNNRKRLRSLLKGDEEALDYLERLVDMAQDSL